MGGSDRDWLIGLRGKSAGTGVLVVLQGVQ